MEKLYITELPKQEQKRNLEERQFQLKIKINKAALPKTSYRVECFMCHQEYHIDLTDKSTLTNDQINAYLISNGWMIGGRGYECVNCFNGYVKAVVAYVKGNDRPTVVDSSTAKPGELV